MGHWGFRGAGMVMLVVSRGSLLGGRGLIGGSPARGAMACRGIVATWRLLVEFVLHGGMSWGLPFRSRLKVNRCSVARLQILERFEFGV